MSLYKIKNNQVDEIRKIRFKNEKELQKLIENNLKEIFNLEFVATEFQVNNLRIDTLAYNPETNSFVIIEYKNLKSFSVIDQGYSYLSVLLNNKAEFVLKYNQQFNKNNGKEAFDFSQTRVMFIAPKFTNYQLTSVKFSDIPFELIEVSKYNNDILTITQVNKTDNKASIKEIKNQTKDDVTKEIKVYNDEYYLNNKKEEIIDLYYNFKERILNEFDDSEPFYTKYYSGFKVNKSIYLTIEVQKSSMKIWINLNNPTIKDSNNIVRNVKDIGHHGIGNYEVKVTEDTDMNYIMTLVKQAYDEKLKDK